jgi:hypothetical protein
MKNGRNMVGQCAAGNTGKPKGSCNKANLAVEHFLQGQAEAINPSNGQQDIKGR